MAMRTGLHRRMMTKACVGDVDMRRRVATARRRGWRPGSSASAFEPVTTLP